MPIAGREHLPGSNRLACCSWDDAVEPLEQLGPITAFWFDAARGEDEFAGARAPSEHLIALGGEHEVALGEAVDLVGVDLDAHLAPGEIEIGVMPVGFGHVSDAIDER